MGYAPLRLTAVTSHPRHALVQELTLVLNDLGAILDCHSFSNLALALHFEVSPPKAQRLRGALLALPMALSTASLEALEHLEASSCEAELTGSLNLTFVHQEPDLRQPIPAVPG